MLSVHDYSNNFLKERYNYFSDFDTTASSGWGYY